MNKKEFMIITEIIMSFFPKFEKKISTKRRLQVWYEMFEDLNFKSTQTALKKVLVDSKFMPTVSEIRQAVADIENPDNSITGSEAWGQVTRSISKYGYSREKEALESMDNRVARLVKRFNWKDICHSKKISVERSNFIKLWNEQQTKEKKHKALPNSVKKQISNNKQKLDNKVKALSDNLGM